MAQTVDVGERSISAYRGICSEDWRRRFQLSPERYALR